MKTMKTCKYGCGKMKDGGKVTAVKKMAKGGSAGCPPGQCPKYQGGKKDGCGPCSAGLIGGLAASIGGSAAVATKMISDAIKAKKAKKKEKEAAKNTEEKKKGGSVKKYAAGGSTIVGMPQYSNNPRTYSGRMLKEGGSFAPNRAVQSSCKGGMVRDANGKCVMSRSFKKGGFPDLNKDGKITKADILKGRGVIKKLGGAKKR